MIYVTDDGKNTDNFKNWLAIKEIKFEYFKENSYNYFLVSHEDALIIEIMIPCELVQKWGHPEIRNGTRYVHSYGIS